MPLMMHIQCGRFCHGGASYVKGIEPSPGKFPMKSAIEKYTMSRTVNARRTS